MSSEAPPATAPALCPLPSERARPETSAPATWSSAAALCTGALCSLLVFFLVQRPAFREILTLAETLRPGPAAATLALLPITTSFALLAPGLALSWLLSSSGRAHAARSTYIAYASLVTSLLLIDVELLGSIGRHVLEIVAIAAQPEGHVAGGSVWGWAPLVLERCAAGTLGALAAALVSERACRALGRTLTPLLRRFLGVLGALGALLGVLAPTSLLLPWRNHPLVERLYASCVLDLRLDPAGDEPRNLDARSLELYRRWSASYRAAFSAVTASKPADATPIALPARPPNVILIVTESLRHDVFTAELMPRLSRWAEGGILAARHDSGTMYSESAMFSLLYSRSAALYHQTLDARVPPQLCATLRASGYRCAFFSGHPEQWQRRQEFLNRSTIDHYVHDDRGSWPDWDRRALDGAVELTQTSQEPVFAIVLLMSSHFEYQYPPEFEIDRPVANSTWQVTSIHALGPEAELPHRNRYRNCVRFIDAAVGGAIERLDPARNLVIFAGDHGESLNDDGRYTHGYSFAEIVTRTPLAMVGPGVPRRRLETPTSHLDLLPSVLHALTGQPQRVAHLQGIDWLAGEQRTSLLEAHSPRGGREVQAQLRAGGHRVRLDLDLERPHIRLLGFEDELGRLIPTPALGDRDVAVLAQAFEDQLSLLRR